jgi:hypothetical protein
MSSRPSNVKGMAAEKVTASTFGGGGIAAPEMDLSTEEGKAAYRERVDQDVALNRGEPIFLYDEQGNTEAVATRLITPDFYEKYMKGNEERVSWGRFEIPKPHPEVTARIYDSIVEHWSTLEMEDPEIVSRLSQYPGLFFADAEIAGTVDRLFEWSPAEELSRYLTGDVPVQGFESYEETWRKTEVTRMFLDKWGPKFKPAELDMISTVFASISADQRDNLSAMADLWWAGGFGYKPDPNNPDDREQFIQWFWDKGQAQNEWLLAKQTGWGRVMDRYDRYSGFNNVRSFFQKRVVPTVLSVSPANPDSLAARQSLTQGQQIIAALGGSPQDGAAWDMASGVYDGMTYLTQDPVNLLVNFGVGAKTARSVAKVGKAAQMGKLELARRTWIPFIGKRAIQGQQLPRSISARVGWTLFSKTTDELVTQAHRAGTFQKIYHILRHGGVSELVETMPGLERVTTTIGQQLVEAKNADEIAEIFRWAATGGFIGDEAPGLTHLVRKADAAREALQRETQAALVNGELSVGQLMHVDGVVPSRGVWDVFDKRPGGVATMSTLDASGATRAVVRADATVAHLDDVAEEIITRLSDIEMVEPGKFLPEGLAIVDSLRRGDALSASQNARLMRVMESLGLDFLATTDESLVLGPKAAQKLVSGVDDGAEAPLRIMQLRGELLRAEASLNSARAADTGLWVISDIPHKVKPPGPIKGLWRKHGSNDADGWWGNYRRSVSARMFAREAPTSIDISNGADAAKELRIFLRQLGVKRSTIQRYYNEIVSVPIERRYDVIQRAVVEAAEEINHPILRHGLKRTIDRQGVFSYGFDALGREVGSVPSSTRPGALSARPWIPSHFTTKIDLPGPEFYTMLRRYRNAQRMGKMGLEWNVRGFLPRTRKARTDLMVRYRNVLEERGILQPGADLQDIASMAYATVGEGWTGGVGAFSRFLHNYPGSSWKAFHSIFTRMQLAMRPISWPFKVVVLEEQFRGALMDQPSMYRNPARMLTRWQDAWGTSRIRSWRQGQAEFVRNVLDNTISPNMAGDQALAAAQRLVPGFSPRKAATAGEIRTELAHALGRALSDKQTFANIDSTSAWLKWRTRRQASGIERVRGRLREIGLPDDWDWFGEAGSEILQKGWTQLFTEAAGSAIQGLEYAPNMGIRAVRQYGRGYGVVMAQALDDPVLSSWGLARLSGDPAAIREFSAEALASLAFVEDDPPERGGDPGAPRIRRVRRPRGTGHGRGGPRDTCI